MKETIQALVNAIKVLEDWEFTSKKNDLSNELRIMKLERGMESLQERIKVKDDIIDDYKDTIAMFKGGNKSVEKK